MPESWQKISNLKVKSQPFGKIDEKQIDLHIYRMIMNINTVAGWILPDAEIMDIFINQLKMKIQESYRFLNTDEIEYAFRNYKVEDYGKNFNLHIFDSVIQKYLVDRKEVDYHQEIENDKRKELIYNTPVQTDDELKDELLEYSKRDYRGRKIYLIPDFLFDNLVKLNLIDVSEKAKVKKFNEAINLHEKLLRAKAEIEMDKESITDYNSYLNMKNNHFQSIDQRTSNLLDSLHKKLYIIEYFNSITEA